jgi:DNA-binding beta-propeller fold protein YncE
MISKQKQCYFKFIKSLAIVALSLLTSSVAHGEAWRFRGPFGVAVNSKDVVYVSEIDNRRVSKFTPDGKWLGVIDQVAGYGRFTGPFDVAVGSNDWLYITDTLAHRVVVLDADEKLQFVLGEEPKSAKEGSFSQPHFVAVNGKGEIFVADTFNARIQKFSPRGKFLQAWGKIGLGPGEFRLTGYLGGISCDGRGHIFVRETDGGRIQKFTETGEYLQTISRRGVKPGELDEGYGCQVIGDTLFAVDTFESRVQRFSLDGALVDVWDPGESNAGNHFNHPTDIAATRDGHLIVTDWKNNRIIKLTAEGEFVKTWGDVTLEELLAYQPPAREPRPAHKRIEFSVYGSTGLSELKMYQKHGIDNVYYSHDRQDGDWGIGNDVAQAKEMGIKVYTSLAMFNFGQNHTFTRQHPEYHIWKHGSTQPQHVLSWGHPEARSFRADHLVAQTHATGIPGIMLDYIRYLGVDYGYDPAIVADFMRKDGRNPYAIAKDDIAWMQHRADYVTDFIVEMRRKLADLDDPPTVCVYLSGDDPTPGVYLAGALQDWRTWARMGIIDKLNVAHYTRDFDRIYQAIRRVKAVVPESTKINCFIACYGGNLNTPELLRKGVDVVVAAGADEVTIYRGDAIWELDLWETIGQITRDVNAGVLND